MYIVGPFKADEYFCTGPQTESHISQNMKRPKVAAAYSSTCWAATLSRLFIVVCCYFFWVGKRTHVEEANGIPFQITGYGKWNTGGDRSAMDIHLEIPMDLPTPPPGVVTSSSPTSASTGSTGATSPGASSSSPSPSSSPPTSATSPQGEPKKCICLRNVQMLLLGLSASKESCVE